MCKRISEQNVKKQRKLDGRILKANGFGHIVMRVEMNEMVAKNLKKEGKSDREIDDILRAIDDN